MPLLGQGIIPTGTIGSELTALTRRAFAPIVVLQIGRAHVTTSAMLAAAEPVSGGLSPVTIPVQYDEMVTVQWTDYMGQGTAPSVRPGVTNAEYNLAALVAWVPFPMMEGLVQGGADIVPVAWARMNGASVAIPRVLSEALWAASGANTTLMTWALRDLINTANPTQGNVGGIDRTANTWWQGSVATITSISGSTTWSRTNVLAAIVSAQRRSGGKTPSLGICSPGAWLALANDVIGAERYITSVEGAYGEAGSGTVQAAFPALNIGGVPIYMDFYQSQNDELVLLDTTTLQYKVHQDATFAMTELANLMPQFQLAYVMAIVTLIQAVTSSPRSSARITGFTGALTP